ncbi:RagB/SusD family nutrient uptake outer membrane protein [Myroides sp. LJL110]
MNSIQTPKNLKLLVILILSLFTSCDDLIEVDLPNNKVNREDVYNDIATTEAALNYIYIRLRDSPLFSKNAQGMSYNLSLFTDELVNNSATYNYFYSNDIQANNLTIKNWWNNAYMDIYAINIFIESLQNAKTIPNDKKNPYLGEAYALRAIYYQYLTQLFGNIPYTTTSDYKLNTTIIKTSQTDIYTYIEKDLLEAIDLLDYSYRGALRVTVNKATAEHLLLLNYILQDKLELAEDIGYSILHNTAYMLEDNIESIFKNNSKGTILQMSPANTLTSTPEASLYLFISLVANSSSMESEFFQSFEQTDFRKNYWINSFTLNNSVYYQPYKYKNKTNNTDEFSIFYRIEETYFLYCEALAKQGKVNQAVDTFNTYRQKRGLTNLNYNISKEEFIEELLLDAKKEFFTESGHRFFDLKRNNMLESLSKTKPNWEKFHILFPIPEDQLLINKNLLPNNVGY